MGHPIPIENLPETFWAYSAGLFDGEGRIEIVRRECTHDKFSFC